MQDGMDAVARGARVVRLDRKFRWPGGRHVAVVLNVAYEGWSDGKAPGIGPMGNPLPADAFDTNALSWGSYGATRGIERLLRALDRAGRRASVMVSGIFAAFHCCALPRPIRVRELFRAFLSGIYYRGKPLPASALSGTARRYLGGIFLQFIGLRLVA